MASSINGALIQRLISSSAGESSPALLALKRWARGAAKPWCIGFVSLLVLLNLGVGAPKLGASQLGASQLGRKAALEAGRVSVETAIASQPRLHPALIRVGANEDAHMPVDAHMTHYRLTRSRLSIPTGVGDRKDFGTSAAQMRGLHL